MQMEDSGEHHLPLMASLVEVDSVVTSDGNHFLLSSVHSLIIPREIDQYVNGRKREGPDSRELYSQIIEAGQFGASRSTDLFCFVSQWNCNVDARKVSPCTYHFSFHRLERFNRGVDGKGCNYKKQWNENLC